MTYDELKNRLNGKNAKLTSDEIINLDPTMLYKLPEKELKKVANVMVSSSNKRVRRLLRAAPKGISDAALRGAGVLNQPYGETDPDELDVRFFSVKGKNRNEITKEVRRMVNFQTMKTSTVKGAIERRKQNEILVFGETREEKVKRIKKEEKQRQRLLKKGMTPEEAERVINDNRPDYIKDALINTEFEGGGLSQDQIMSVVFKHYRKYAETHSVIVRELGSDFIIRMIGQFAQGKARQVHNMEELEDALKEVDALIEAEWEKMDTEENKDFFEQMDDYTSGKTTKKPEFSSVDGWR